MKISERLTFVTFTAATAAATAACAGYLIRHILRIRAERIFRVAAGESPYERSHPRQHGAQAA